jgi:hypothetical protein
MNTEELNALKERAYKTAVAHGFYKDAKSNAYYLDLVMSEMGGAIKADCKGWHANVKGYEAYISKGFPFKLCFGEYIKNSLEDEIADIVIRLLDFAGMKGYTLSIQGFSFLPSILVIKTFVGNGLPGILFQLNGALNDSLDYNGTEAAIGIVIGILSDCFEKITGSDKDLWWFVDKKMTYNEM